jgi:hypothetical protein
MSSVAIGPRQMIIDAAGAHAYEAPPTHRYDFDVEWAAPPRQGGKHVAQLVATHNHRAGGEGEAGVGANRGAVFLTMLFRQESELS